MSNADGSFPKAARLIAEDFNTLWWEDPSYQKSVELYSNKITTKTAALRQEIANHLKLLDKSAIKNSEYAEEIEILSTLSIDGVITTNWDMFIEELFPNYKVYIGQNELLFSTTQNIGEIYKIHGCIKEINSLVLTDYDYHDFEEKNKYLASKLITLFIEHLIIFIGYSLSDPNIKSILKSIALCIGEEHINQLRKNLIFVQRLKNGEKDSVSHTYHTIDDVQIPIVLVKTNDFRKVYRALSHFKRKIPVNLLRLFKQELYELVKTDDPKNKLYVADIEEFDSSNSDIQRIELIAGVGIINQYESAISSKGYTSITTSDLLQDLLFDNQEFDHFEILNQLIPELLKRSKYIPVFKYLKQAGITSQEEYNNSNFQLDKIVNIKLEGYANNSYKKAFFKQRKNSIEDFITSFPPNIAVRYISCMNIKNIKLDVLKQFLITHQDKLTCTSDFRKLASLYDRLKYGW